MVCEVTKRYLTSNFQMFDKQCLIVWPGSYTIVTDFSLMPRFDSVSFNQSQASKYPKQTIQNVPLMRGSAIYVELL